MKRSEFRVVSCAPGDALFAEAICRVRPEQSGALPAGVSDASIPHSALVVLRAGEPVGRLAVYRNAAMQIDGKPVAQLGDFDCVGDVDAAGALLDAAVALARTQGAAYVVGPMNGSTWNAYRFATWSGGEPRFFTEPDDPDYYPALWQSAGFAPFQKYVSSLAPVLNGNAIDVFSGNGLSVRGIRPDAFRQDLELVYPLCSAAFAGNPLFTPIDPEAFIAKLLPLRPLISPAFTKIVTDQAGEAAAFILAMPDVLNPDRKRLILKPQHAIRNAPCMA